MQSGKEKWHKKAESMGRDETCQRVGRKDVGELPGCLSKSQRDARGGAELCHRGVLREHILC